VGMGRLAEKCICGVEREIYNRTSASYTGLGQKNENRS